MGRLDTEMAGYAAEVDTWTADLIVLIDGENLRLSVSATVGEFMVGWELDRAGNKRQIRQAHIVIFKATNPDLSAKLAAAKVDAIPQSWQCELRGKAYRVTGPSVDELAYEFDIQQGIS